MSGCTFGARIIWQKMDRRWTWYIFHNTHQGRSLGLRLRPYVDLLAISRNSMMRTKKVNQAETSNQGAQFQIRGLTNQNKQFLFNLCSQRKNSKVAHTLCAFTKQTAGSCSRARTRQASAWRS